jgi:hypothetical protein
MATVDLGKVAFVWKGTYASGTTYESKDVVQYTDSGETSSYIYVNASSASGQTPSTSGTVNTTYWAKMAGGTSLSVGNNKIVTTDASGNVSSVALGSAGEALKVNSGANGLEFGSAGKNMVLKTMTTQSALTASTTLIDADIVTSKASPVIQVSSLISLNCRSADNLDEENIRFDIEYSTNGGSSYTTLANNIYMTDVFSPGRSVTHANAYDINVRPASAKTTLTGIAIGTTVNVRVRLDYGAVQNSRTIYINRSPSNGSGVGSSHLLIYEE